MTPGAFTRRRGWGGRYFKGTAPVQEDYNSTGSVGTVKFTAAATGTVGVSVSGSLKVSESALIESVEATFGINVTASLTAQMGNEYDTPIPARTAYDGQYGVWRRRSTGVSYVMYSNCTSTARSGIVSYIPYAVGWYVWKA